MEKTCENISDNALVVKSNRLISQTYRLTANERKIIYLLISQIEPDDQDFKPYPLKIENFINLAGLDGRDKFSIKSGIPKITKELLKKGFSVIDEKSNLLQVNWLSSAYHRRKEGIVELEFSPKLKPYLLQLKEKFTAFEIKNVLRLKSAYSMRIYELLKQYETVNLKKRTIELEELKLILGIDELKAYNLYSNVKLKILEVAREELKQTSDIYFRYREIKERKKVIAIEFDIIRKNNIENENSKTSNLQVGLSVDEFGQLMLKT